MTDETEKRTGIRWPEEFLPEKTPIHVRNELRIDAPAEVVWAWLVRAVRWPEWYFNSSGVRFENQDGLDLKDGTVFWWKTFDVKLVSQVKEFVPCQRLAWDARAFGINAYHAWLLTPVEGGCEVLTEETQHGWLARLGDWWYTGRMYERHQIWLEKLRLKAQSGLP
jgi:uncharacterized protein YndB with AHSA1/START domain